MSDEHKPGTLFERHPRPWKVQTFPQTYIGSIPYDYVEDANGNRVAGDPHQPWLMPRKLIDIINADAPKPFVPGWYWLRHGPAGTLLPYQLTDEDAQRRHVAAGYIIGPRIEPPQGFGQ